MSDRFSDAARPRRRTSSLARPRSRETVRDLALVIASTPTIACLLYLPVAVVEGGRWGRLLGLLAVLAVIWWGLRLLLDRWVAAAGDRDAGPPPSRR